MLISYVIRLLPAALFAGELAGEVEHVPSGARANFRGADELAARCAQPLHPAVPTPRSTPVDLYVLPSLASSADPGATP